ncbi:MAG: hypothetical protein JRJ29_14540 [Deltaproteobacteria bacterium]|nr:hypothetical protein [Deltaproteobacteria bacterium]
MKNLTRVLFAVTSVALLLGACASTKLTSAWVDENYQGGPVSNILVICVTDQEGARRSYESKFVKELEALGVKAVSSADVIRIPAGKKLQKETILRAVNKLKNDAVLIMHLVGVEKKDVYTPPSYQTYPNDLYGFYGHVYTRVHTPGYYTTHTYVRLETNLYDVKTEKLIWSAQSETWNPASGEQLIDEVIRVVIKDMQKYKLLP